MGGWVDAGRVGVVVRPSLASFMERCVAQRKVWIGAGQGKGRGREEEARQERREGGKGRVLHHWWWWWWWYTLIPPLWEGCYAYIRQHTYMYTYTPQ